MGFILLDKVTALEAGKRAQGFKGLTASEDYFGDHFPGEPLYPGSLLIESLAQLGGLLVEVSLHKPGQPLRRAMLASVEKAKFHAPSRPGDALQLDCQLEGDLGLAARIRGEASCEGEKRGTVELTFRLIEVNRPALHAQRERIYREWLRDWKGAWPLPW